MGTPTHISSAAHGTIASSSFTPIHSMCPTAGVAVMQPSAFSFFANGGFKFIVLPPLPTTGQRLSSSELTLNTKMCPVAFNRLMNM